MERRKGKKWMIKKYCVICGKENSNRNRPYYCSDDCSIEAMRRQSENRTVRNTVNGTDRISYFKMRFEVLERDIFTCQYCGRRAPDVQLQVDHIYPVIKGGVTEKHNLITSCSDCNNGKSDSILSLRASAVISSQIGGLENTFPIL